MPKKKSSAPLKPASKLSDSEMDLLSHMEQGYQLETDSLGSEPVLRRLKDDEVIRAASANRATVQSLEKRGLIAPGKSADPLTIVWRLAPKKK
jgi:cytosine/adenosine deaminase-related metal-dependent hydrolase